MAKPKKRAAKNAIAAFTKFSEVSVETVIKVCYDGIIGSLNQSNEEGKNIKAKFKLTKDQNVFFARQNMAQLIHDGIALEGMGVSVVETETILNGINLGHVSLDTIQMILNLQRAWDFLLSSIGETFDLDYIDKVHGHVVQDEEPEWEKGRGEKTGKSEAGSDSSKMADAITGQIRLISELESATEKAIRFFLWACKEKLFGEGNTRTNMLCANKIIIEAGEGILTVTENRVSEFQEKFSRFCDSGDFASIDQWMYENCIAGMDF